MAIGLWTTWPAGSVARYRVGMRWESLFADLEAQLESEQDAAFDAEVADRIHVERVSVSMLDRVRACIGQALMLVLVEGEPVTGEVTDAGADWVLVRSDRGDVLVPLRAVCAVDGLGAAATAGGALARRITLSVVLRGLAERRSPVLLQLRGGSVLSGSVQRVGGDHLDLTVHPVDEPWNAGRDRAVPFAAVVRVTTRG